MPEEHVPVLFQQVLEELRVRTGGRYIDGTVGAAGHARGILSASAPDGQLLGLDADPSAITRARRLLEEFGTRAKLQVANFRDLRAIAAAQGFDQVDGILLDLGISSLQLADAERGFSFSRTGPLDMRLNPQTGRNAADLVNRLSQEELSDILWRLGEERYARRIARSIVANRPVTTTEQLAELVARSVPYGGRIHPATRTFMALRIAVNDELQSLAQALPQARDLLRSGGRLAVIAFHSLEDRLVKRFIQQESRDCLCPPRVPVCACQHKATLRAVTRKPVQPAEKELDENPRSRSARLRTAERL